MTESCCVKFAKIILIFVNVVFTLIGAGIIGLSAYLLAGGSGIFNVGSQSILDTGALWVGVIFGVALVFVSVMGCFGAMRGAACGGKCFLFFYSTIVFAVIAAELAVGVIVLLLGNNLGELSNTKVGEEAKDLFEGRVNLFVNQSYTTCCNPQTKQAQNPQDVVCSGVLAQAQQFGSDMCSSPDEFKKDILMWLKKYVVPVGVSIIVLAVVEVLCLAAACHIMCCAKKESDFDLPLHDKSAQLSQQQRQQQQQYGQAGGDLAYGGAAPATGAGGIYA